MIKNATACSFTGHRDIPAEHRGKLKNLLSETVSAAYEDGCRRFFAGGALGFDTEAAREVLLFRISHPDVSLVLLLPCRDQDKYWRAEERESYSFILKNADEVIYVSEHYDFDCMKRRNQRLADECDLLVAYLTHSRSGAGQTVRMAEQQGKRVINLADML